MDTTRADALGRVEGGAAQTPSLDALARRGTSYANAVSPAPLTFPAHCSLMTGLNPPVHGIHDNGIGVLSRSLPTLAQVLSSRGYVTGAFVSSRVLDHRFGLDRGFSTYDDRMVAEQMGEQGYPERDAREVTDAALAWAAALPSKRPAPYFLWIHYYDPHAPYSPPGDWTGQSAARRYAAEVAYMDAQIGRLLRELPETPGGRLVAAVGDHGEMLGEHGEKEHGIFLYRGSLSVPLLLAGPSVPEGGRVLEPVGIRALPGTLLTLLGLPEDAVPFGATLPVASRPRGKEPAPVYSETLLPADTYGWSPLRGVTVAGWRYIEAPRPELYDLTKDPNESNNVAAGRPDDVARLRRLVAAAQTGSVPADSSAPDPELAASLRSLGYLGGSSPRRPGGLDPKDGIALLAEFDEAKEWMREGRARDAVAKFEGLVRKSPDNVPFLLRLGDAQLGAGMPAEGLRSLARAIELSPRLDFLHVRLAQAYAELGRAEDAKREYRATLELNPRSAPAWSGLAEVARRTEGAAAERRVLEQCEAAGTMSASLLRRLAELERGMGDAAVAERHAAEAEALAAHGAPPR